MSRDLVVKKVAYLGFLVALNIIFTRVLSFRFAIGGVEGVRLGIGGLPIIMAGILFGPLAGGIAGAVGDIAGFIVSPMGAYMPHFTLTAALTGIIPGLIIKTVFNCRFTFWRILSAVAVGQIITSVVLVPYFLNLLFEMPYETTLLPAVVGQGLSIPLYAFLLVGLCRRLLASDVLEPQVLSCKLNN